MNLDLLRRRTELLDRLRAFFKQRGFLEVQTPLAAREAIPEQHIRLYQLLRDERLLQASPEMHHKRLLCAGSGPIFEVTRSFRGGEWGKLHNPEFTIVEWYRPDDDLDAAMTLTDELMQSLLGAPPAVRTSYREAFRRTLGVDPHLATAAELKRVARGQPTLDLGVWRQASRDDCLNFLLSLCVEQTLGNGAPELLYHYPAGQSALAATTRDEQGAEVAERFELYWRGIELANGYHELTDPAELRERLERANGGRVAQGWPAVPLPEELLAAMSDPGLPPCAGVALGFDRLVMLATGAASIGEVTAFLDTY
ncbi:EF-P lysine aminoacylase EpmA [Botrimarina sp.]|uniref:EF-P lysine aminoacylase EpmA n=1 Tax=Botrimarina sp. TaxID=2795802 RepID=UPI0032F08D03